MDENFVSDNYSGMVLDDRYELRSRIGEGGMALVYSARDRRLDRLVAVKIMREEIADDEDFKARFSSESHAVAMLSHPNIVAVYDVSQDRGIDYIVMELVSGITLRQYMQKKGALPWREVLHFSRQIASGLSHAHEKGIVHQDIKPQNIMMLRDGTVKVSDFGIAALGNEVAENAPTAIGSLNYSSPEQLRGSSPDPRSDIYSLGVMMYEMLAGKKPYTGSTPGEVLVAQMGRIPPLHNSSDEIPAEVRGLVRRAMSINADDRYQTANEILSDIDDITVTYLNTAPSAPSAHSSPTPEYSDRRPQKQMMDREGRRRSRRRAGSIGFAIGSFGLLATAVFAFSFLWRFWLCDVFSAAERIILPDFTGYNYQTLSTDSNLAAKYNFIVIDKVDDKNEKGTILRQEPVAGRSLMVNPDGIDVTLTVATGHILSKVPDVMGIDYREATLKLTNAGFVVESESIMSEEFEKDIVISTSPSAGESISSGSTVYMDISGGTQIDYVKMPNLVGLTEEAAVAKISRYGLTYGGSAREESELEAGTVIRQSILAFADIQEHGRVSITVSSGPKTQIPDPYTQFYIGGW